MTNNDTDYDKLIKITLAGNYGTGKTSFLKMFCDNEFQSDQDSTIGVEVRSKYIKQNEKMIRLQLVDTAGKRCFRNLISAYYRDSKFILLLFDLTNLQSFHDLDEWVKDIESRINNTQKIILVGNKSDQQCKRSVSDEIIDEFVERYDFMYYETSAKKNTGINEIFQTIIENEIGSAPPVIEIKKPEPSRIGCWNLFRFWDFFN